MWAPTTPQRKSGLYIWMTVRPRDGQLLLRCHRRTVSFCGVDHRINPAALLHARRSNPRRRRDGRAYGHADNHWVWGPSQCHAPILARCNWTEVCLYLQYVILMRARLRPADLVGRRWSGDRPRTTRTSKDSSYSSSFSRTPARPGHLRPSPRRSRDRIILESFDHPHPSEQLLSHQAC